MNRFRFLLLSLALAAAAPLASLAQAQTWPNRPVRLIVPYPAGTANEVFARVVAAKLADTWGQAVIVDALPGAGGVIGTQVLAKASSDGYTLGWISSPHAINPAIYHSMPFDSVKDFHPIVNLASTPLVFVSGTNFKANTIPELIALAKASPGQVSFASNGNGSSSQLATELFASITGVKLLHVPYKATGQMTSDLVSGQVQFAALGVVTSQSLVKGGKLKALGVTGPTRSPLLPDVPAVAETVPGYQAKAWMGIVAPAGVPEAVVSRVQADATDALRDPEVIRAMKTQGLDVDLLGPSQFAQRIAADIKTWGKVVNDAGIKVD